jgi:hypothetical protein
VAAAKTGEAEALSELLLLTALQVAVPMRIMDLRALPPGARTNQIRWWAEDAAGVIAARGDILQYGGKRGKSAAAFDWLARGLAAAAFSPGGITFLGVHWCTDHLACVEAACVAASRLDVSG